MRIFFTQQTLQLIIYQKFIILVQMLNHIFIMLLIFTLHQLLLMILFIFQFFMKTASLFLSAKENLSTNLQLCNSLYLTILTLITKKQEKSSYFTSLLFMSIALIYLITNNIISEQIIQKALMIIQFKFLMTDMFFIMIKAIFIDSTWNQRNLQQCMLKLMSLCMEKMLFSFIFQMKICNTSKNLIIQQIQIIWLLL
ncbi:transmembrane protein, putative (macronuclear) [Tetrahymena thermophila SB210]|uniref:Transmembrane protein, putative n=1 Tax=Tetrahymena thermophila (strain SB210) TaxID=312017 RepID=W7XGS8_TETTS|nr:transmembrane protein, putative [Tetrahymena thermophila SB210]EWS76253.1 transmembrane protein, putative [Tetrahymena thermophila SB210]|eukprot:XP_012651212.1 transmembrane protein, putative [Tetrahymena thermophila SB210]